MKQEHRDYINSVVKKNDNFLVKIEDSYEKAIILCPEEIENVFVSEIEDHGMIVFSSVWFFSKNFVFEFPIGGELLDITLIKNTLLRVEFKTFHTKLNSIDSSSRIEISFQTKYLVSGTLMATKYNCLQLLKIYQDNLKQYFLDTI
jgi:hypothetical protein